MKNLMVDIETMGQGSNAAVVAIGAVMFDNTGLGDRFYIQIDLKQAAHFGEIDPDTVLWWLKQSDDARKALTEGDRRLPLEAIALLEHFINRYGPGVKVWGNGSDFDNVILGNLFKKLDIDIPWKFWDNRCYRTVKNLYKDVKMQRTGTHHNALDDAVSQAEHLMLIAQEKGIAL